MPNLTKRLDVIPVDKDGLRAEGFYRVKYGSWPGVGCLRHREYLNGRKHEVWELLLLQESGYVIHKTTYQLSLLKVEKRIGFLP